MSDQLNRSDLADVQRKLYAVRTEWYNLGLELGQADSTLDSINKCYSGNPNECFRQVLKEWLKGIDPLPTWQGMMNALRSPTVAHHQLADQIQSELPSQLPSALAQQHPGPSSYRRTDVARRNYHLICGKFASLVKKASSKLQSIINIDDFRLYVINLFQPGKCIPESESVREIFNAITQNKLWDCVNYFPLKLIIEEFAYDDTEMSEWVKQYEEARSGYMFCTKISDHIGEVAASALEEQLEVKPAKYDTRYYRTLSLKVEARVTEISMQYVSELWKSLASHYHLPSLTAILDSVHAKCILVTWLVPTKHLELIQKAHADPDFFQEHKILWAAVDDDQYLYKSKEEPVNMPAQNVQSAISVTTHDRVQDIPGLAHSPEKYVSGSTEKLPDVSNAVCKVEVGNATGTGFLGMFDTNTGSLVHGLFTNNHVLSEHHLADDQTFAIKFDGVSVGTPAIRNPFILTVKTTGLFRFTCPILGATFIKFEDEYMQCLISGGCKFLKIKSDWKGTKGRRVFVCDDKHCTGEIFLQYHGLDMFHSVSTDYASPGSPITKQNGKVIGLHKARSVHLKDNYNVAVAMIYVIKAIVRQFIGPNLPCHVVTNPTTLDPIYGIERLKRSSELSSRLIYVSAPTYVHGILTITPIWFAPTSHGWYWTPTDPSSQEEVTNWMPVSQKSVIGGDWHDNIPNDENVDIIVSLAAA